MSPTEFLKTKFTSESKVMYREDVYSVEIVSFIDETISIDLDVLNVCEIDIRELEIAR